jgi:catalase
MIKLIGFLLFLSLSIISTAQEIVTPEHLMGKLEEIMGVNLGQRRNHAQGICVNGYFIGNASVQKYSNSPLFSGNKINVVGRFSLASPSLKTPDYSRASRGLALMFQLPEGKKQVFAMLDIPVFSEDTPQTAYNNLIALALDPDTGEPDLKKIAANLKKHPPPKALVDFDEEKNPVTSYVHSDFFSIHTFKFINQSGTETLVKWRFDPQNGVKRLSDEQLETMPSRFLNQELMSSLKAAPASWDMILVIGHPDDEQMNPTILWPKNRQEIKAGILTLTSASPQEEGECGNLNFDPLIMAEGIKPTDDPVLQFRSPAYLISYKKRLEEQNIGK